MHYLTLFIVLLFPFTMLADSPLRDHPSAYLAQHADDPLQWQLWGHPAFEQARRENKLIFVSSGYFACHWCHVMQRESYQDAAIAAWLNQYFIAIKLDRELRPDLDTYLFDFVERTHGIAGWPLNVFLTPDGQPLLGLVYLPAEEFLQVIQTLQTRWQADSEALSELARQAAFFAEDEAPPSDPAGREALREALQQTMLVALQRQGDFLSGGIGQGSKFPQVPLLSLLLEHYPDHPEMADLLHLTLEQMRRLGLRDHLGGGFFRYTVDPDWQEPHFEKMLYDNAQLAWLYLQAAERLDEPRYRQVATETLDFMLRTMWHPHGGLIGSLSAVDDSATEGGYYLWDPQQLALLLEPEQRALIELAWGMDPNPIWAEGYLPMQMLDAAQLAARLGRDEGAITVELRQIRQRLMRARQQRVMPADDKRLAGWNGLALSALSLASREQTRFVPAAQAISRYLHSLWDGEQLWLLRDNHDRKQQAALLEDYALVARALYDWYLASGENASRDLAVELLQQAGQRFYTGQGWRLGDSDDAYLLGQSYLLLSAGPLPSPATVLLQLQAELDISAIPEAALWAAPGQLVGNPLDYPDYLALMLRDGAISPGRR